MPKLTAKSRPGKPYAGFPLFAHANGQWAKKIRGRLFYFGLWADADAALKTYLDQRDDLHAGRTPRVAGEGLTVGDMVNLFLDSKQNLLDSGEITRRTFDDYKATGTRLIEAFGRNRLVDDLAADDFEQLRAELAKRWGPVALGNEVARVRIVFKYAHDSGLTDRPMRYGQSFKRPSKKVLRKARNKKGPRMFEAAELGKMLKAAGTQMKAMILLGVNCGFGNTDVGTLPIKALNLKSGWVDFPRPKTGITRRCPLWPETVKAIKAALADRTEPKDEADSGLVFITKYGQCWSREMARNNPVAAETTKLLKDLGIHRTGLSFYALRHTFETIAGDSRDQVAVDAIMGHSRSDMASLYREKIEDDRLRAVADHVHSWLFAKVKAKTTTKSKTSTSAKAKAKHKAPKGETKQITTLRVFTAAGENPIRKAK